MKNITLAFFFFTLPALAQPLATVTLEHFTPGRTWAWEYRRESGELYSTERYSVVSVRGNEVLLEMSTAFPGMGNFEAHHRIRVPLDRCLAAYADRERVMPWSFRMYYSESGNWREVTAPSTLAFEEKFNCNPHRDDSLESATEFKNSPAGELFRHKRWGLSPGTWFLNTGRERGVAFEKTFVRENGGESYRMVLDWSGIPD